MQTGRTDNVSKMPVKVKEEKRQHVTDVGCRQGNCFEYRELCKFLRRWEEIGYGSQVRVSPCRRAVTLYKISNDVKRMGADTGTFLYLVEGSWGSFQLILWKKPILGTVKRTVKKSLNTENISLQEPSFSKNFDILNMIKEYLAPTNRKKKS